MNHLTEIKDLKKRKPRPFRLQKKRKKKKRPNRRKEVFYLTTHSVHFIYNYMTSVNCL